MKEINVLPRIIVPDSIPSAYDVTSMNAIEQTGKVYAAVRELQEYFNSFMSEINQAMTDFQNGVLSDQNSFEEQLTKIIHDYIHLIDEKIKMQDLKIEHELAGAIEELLNELVNKGELENIITTYEYNASNETLTFKMGGVE